MNAGDVIDGRFRLDKLLGEGGFGAVWLARELSVDRRVALKFLHTSFDHQTRRRFQRESEALARLSHEHIIALYQTGELDGIPYLVTEYVEGETLSSWIAAPRTQEEVFGVGAQIASALVAAHRAGIVHRDLKPANVMVMTHASGAPRVKVLDFGIAKLAGAEQYDITKTGEVIGTPGFMSPEQLRAAPNVGPPTDLYNLGVILWEMLEGRRLFEAQSALEMCMLHLKQEAPPLSQRVPAAVAELVHRLLQKEPAARGRAVDVLRVLQNPWQQRPVAPAAPPTPIPAPRLRPTTGLGLALLGGLVVVVVVVVAALFAMQDDAPPPRRVAPRAPVNVSALIEPPPTRVSVDLGRPAPDATVAPDAALGGTTGCGVSWAPGQLLASAPEVLKHTTVRLDWDDDRSIIVVPAGYDAGQPMPLVLVLHDGAYTPQQMLVQAAQLVEQADKRRGIVVFAEGERLMTSRTVLRALQKGGARTELPMAGYPWPRRHIVRVLQLIALLKDAFCVDPTRMFLVGHGRGATGAERLLSRTRDFAAVALTSHRLRTDEQRPLADDEMVPRIWTVPRNSRRLTDDGAVNDCRRGYALMPYAEQRDLLRTLHRCNGPPEPVRTSKGGTCETWACEVPLVSCRIEGGQHWPGFTGTDDCGGPVPSFDFGARIWKFFEDNSREP